MAPSWPVCRGEAEVGHVLGVLADGVLCVDAGTVQAKERRADKEEESTISVRYGDGRRGQAWRRGRPRLWTPSLAS
jgi:hypothetical protein